MPAFQPNAGMTAAGSVGRQPTLLLAGSAGLPAQDDVAGRGHDRCWRHSQAKVIKTMFATTRGPRADAVRALVVDLMTALNPSTVRRIGA